MAKMVFFSEDRTDKQKKFDRKFMLGVALVVAAAIVLVVTDMGIWNYTWGRWVGLWIATVALIANLIKGNFDWRAKRKREKENPTTKVDSVKIQKLAETIPDAYAGGKKTRAYEREVKDESEAELGMLVATVPADTLTLHLANLNKED